MPKYRCQSCGKTFHGWAKQRICKVCGGVLKAVTEEKGEEVKK
ncbi:unnamed protein product [marine sediment metagenome]|uniref:Uncharacterized protein n=1 Tax=marine sediment metagenome TaxID=412755 RepID=X1SZR4_9ZZZZ